MTKPFSFRLSAPAELRLRSLALVYGSQARALEVAIERLYTAEVKPDQDQDQDPEGWDQTIARVRAGWLAMIREQAHPEDKETER